MTWHVTNESPASRRVKLNVENDMTNRQNRQQYCSRPPTANVPGSHQFVSDLSAVSPACYGEVSDKMATSFLTLPRS